MLATPLIRVSCKMVADFMLATATKQRKTLAEYKYPDEDEPAAKRLYYREARDTVRAFHHGLKSSEWLEAQGEKLADLASLLKKGPAKSRLINNARTIADYAKHYSSGEIVGLETFKGAVEYGRVQIRVVPDLVGVVNGRKKCIRLEHGKVEPNPKYSSVMCQLMYEAAKESGWDLPASAFIVRHIAGKKDFASAKKGARLVTDINATCLNIEGIWETI